MRCPTCSYDNRATRRFCAECGAALAPTCASCGASNAPGEKFCGGCGVRLSSVAAEPEAAPVPVRETELPAGERRQLTALFCDLVGSTEIASRLDPEDWHRISKDYQSAAAAAVTRFGGHVDKFLGDGLVCFFGVPQAHEDDAERAVRAGLAIVEAVKGLGVTELRDRTADPTVTPNPLTPNLLSVRVGMHTGSAVVAHGGGESRDVFGDTPNIAARVQAAAEPDTVVISAATQRLGGRPLRGRGTRCARAQGRAATGGAVSRRAAERRTKSARRVGGPAHAVRRQTDRARGARRCVGARDGRPRADRAGAGRSGARKITPLLPAARAPQPVSRTRGSSAAAVPTRSGRRSVR